MINLCCIISFFNLALTFHFCTAPQPWWSLQTTRWKIPHGLLMLDVCTLIPVLPPLSLHHCPHSTHSSLQNNSVVSPLTHLGCLTHQFKDECFLSISSVTLPGVYGNKKHYLSTTCDFPHNSDGL